MPKEYHPGISLEILIDGNIIGYIGKIHPNVNKNNIYLCELGIDKLFEIGIKKIKFKEIQKYPSIVKDIAFMLDKNVNSIDIVNVITKKGGKEVVNVDIFDVFEIQDKKSIAFKITFQDPTKTLTDEEVNISLNTIIEEIEREFNAELRNK
jgi:phenylalanyl-tRNA synthetase beta chain